jgi:hypothetical protein
VHAFLPAKPSCGDRAHGRRARVGGRGAREQRRALGGGRVARRDRMRVRGRRDAPRRVAQALDRGTA